MRTAGIDIFNEVCYHIFNPSRIVPPTRKESAMNAQTSTPSDGNDRCDRCCATAVERVTLPSGGELLFCGHHARKYKLALELKAAVVTPLTING